MAALRVVVAEDSATDRALLVGLLESDPTISVVGEAHTGAEAVQMALRLRPDVITMDIHMPVMDGLEATERIMRDAPTPIVIVSSTTNRQDVDLSVAAAGVGAVMVLEKPVHPLSPAFDEYRARFLGLVKAMAGVKVVRRWSSPASRPAFTPPHGGKLSDDESVGGRRINLVAITASTGGPAAIQQLLRKLPAQFGAPILVVQHIARGFIEGLAQWLGGYCELRVKVVAPGDRLAPGTVYLAPDDRHLGARDRWNVELSNAEPIGGFRPSGTYLFQSVARTHGAGVAAVVLTGMGDDGVAGLAAVKAAGGYVIAQDEGSSIVYGMPREAVRSGLVHAVLPPDELGTRLIQLTRGDRDGASNTRR